MYKESHKDTDTFALGAIFVTTNDVSKNVIYSVVKSVFKTLTPSKNFILYLNHLKNKKC